MIFHRLLLREIGVPLVLALLLVSQLLIVMQMLQLNEVLFGSGFDWRGVVRVASYLAPHFGIIAVPLAFLLAVMLGIGRLNEDNELVALAALGRSPFMLFAVPAAIGLVLGLVVGTLSLYGEPWGMKGLHHQLNEIIKRNVAGDVRPGTFNEEIPRFTLFVGQRPTEKGEWNRVLLHDSSLEGAPLLMLAQKGRVESDGADELLRLDLKSGEVHRSSSDGSYTHGRFETASIALGVSNFLRRNNRFKASVAELVFSEMPELADRARAANRHSEARVIETNYHARIASFFTCFVFGLVAVPLAIGRRGARGRSFAATVFAFAIYYVIQTSANGMGENGRVAPIVAAWMPNLFALAIAGILAWRLRRGQQLGARR
jgi:lipopolysaccharide export system permease protein